MKFCPKCKSTYDDEYSFCKMCGSVLTDKAVRKKEFNRNIIDSFLVFKFMSLLIAYLMAFLLIFSFSFADFKSKSDIYPKIFKTIKLEQLSEGDKFWTELAVGKNFNRYKRNDEQIFDLYVTTFINGYNYVSVEDKINSLTLMYPLHDDKDLLSLFQKSALYANEFLHAKALLIENNSHYINYCYAGAALASTNFLYFILCFLLVTCVWYVIFYRLDVDWVKYD